MSNCSKKITVQVSKFNNIEYPLSCQKEICCDYDVSGTYWKQPVLDKGGSVIGYNYTPSSETKPSTDSIKIVRLTSCGATVEVVIADADTDAVIKAACDLCCGDAP